MKTSADIIKENKSAIDSIKKYFGIIISNAQRSHEYNDIISEFEKLQSLNVSKIKQLIKNQKNTAEPFTFEALNLSYKESLPPEILLAGTLPFSVNTLKSTYIGKWKGNKSPPSNNPSSNRLYTDIVNDLCDHETLAKEIKQLPLDKLHLYMHDWALYTALSILENECKENYKGIELLSKLIGIQILVSVNNIKGIFDKTFVEYLKQMDSIPQPIALLIFSLREIGYLDGSLGTVKIIERDDFIKAAHSIKSSLGPKKRWKDRNEDLARLVKEMELRWKKGDPTLHSEAAKEAISDQTYPHLTKKNYKAILKALRPAARKHDRLHGWDGVKEEANEASSR
jgi:hypothetical protein